MNPARRGVALAATVAEACVVVGNCRTVVLSDDVKPDEALITAVDAT